MEEKKITAIVKRYNAMLANVQHENILLTVELEAAREELEALKKEKEEKPEAVAAE